jgi:hypothetical protein
MRADDLPERLDRWADAGDFGRGPSKTDLRRLASARIRALEAQVAELREALEPFVRHARAIGVLSGDNGSYWIMTDTGHREVPAADFVRAAALQRKEPQG